MPHSRSHGSNLIIGVFEGMRRWEVFKTQRTNLGFHIQAVLDRIWDVYVTVPEDTTLNVLFKTKPSGCALQHFLSQSKTIDGGALCRGFTNCIPPREVEY